MKPSRQSARISHPDYLSPPERSVRCFTASTVEKTGRVAWHNCRERYKAAAEPTAMAQALQAAKRKRGEV